MRGLICLLCLPAAIAQPSADPWSGLRAKNPPGVEVSLRLLRDGSYREGELIRAEVHYPGPSAPVQRPPLEMWGSNGFLLDPAAACGAPASPCFPTAPRPDVGGGISNGPVSYPPSPLVSLNGYLHTPRPGKYRVAALARKQVLTNRGPMSSSYGYANPAQYAVSNTIDLEVVAASPEWITQAIAASVANLKGPQPNNREAYEARTVAAEVSSQ